MLNIPEEIKHLFWSNNLDQATQKKFKLSFYNEEIDVLYPYETLFPDEDLFPADHGDPWLVIENNRIVTESLVITEALCENTDIEFGSCEATMVEITVADIEQDLTGKEFVLTMEIGGFAMAMGIYKIGSYVRQSDRRKRKITAFDRMRIFFTTDVSDWYNSIVFPTTVKAFRDSLCDYLGITQEQTTLPLDGMSVEDTIIPQQLTGVDVLKAICEINGCFGHFDKTGNLKYIQLPSTGLYPSETLYPDDEELYPSQLGGDGSAVEPIIHYKQPMTYEDYLVDGIDQLQIRQEENDIGAIVGNGSNGYIIEGNFLMFGKSSAELLEIGNITLGAISGRIYRPCKVELPGLPYVEVGDGFIAQTRDDVVESFVMKRTLRGIQSLMDTFEATGNIQREEVYGINKEIIQLRGKTAVITKSVEEVSVRVTDLKEYTEAEFRVTANAITAEVTRATEAESQLRITADGISARVTNLKNDTEAKFLITDQQINAKVSKGSVTSELNIEPGLINLDSNRITWRSDYSSMTANGILTCRGIKAVDGEFSGTITGSSFVGGSINIDDGTFRVTSDGQVDINTGNINIGAVSITSNYVDLGAFRVSSSQYGALFSTNGEVTLSTSAWVDGGPALELKSGGYRSRLSAGGLSCYDIYLTHPWMGNWTLIETLQELWDRTS